MEPPGDGKNDLEVQEGPENCMEPPGDGRNDLEVQEGPENCMEPPGDSRNDLEVQEGPENHMEPPGDDRNKRRHPRQLWQWNRVYPRGNFRPTHISFTGNERIMERLPDNPSYEDFFKLYITGDMIDHLVTQIHLQDNT